MSKSLQEVIEETLEWSLRENGSFKSANDETSTIVFNFTNIAEDICDAIATFL